MKLTALEIEKFRNIEKMKIEPCENVNVIYGENAQGKTNLLEAIWLFTGCKSFRGVKDSELITFGEKKSKLKLDYISNDRDQYMEIEIEDRREISKNGIEYPFPSKAMGQINCVVFSPTHLNLIKQGPAERRKFVDIAISQLRPVYTTYMLEYTRALKQRNALLKDASSNPTDYAMLDVWEERLSEYGSLIAKYRLDYLQKIRNNVVDIYSGLSSERERMEISYVQNGTGTGLLEKDEFMYALRHARIKDIAFTNTSVGIHRDDIEITIGDKSAKRFASQGQQRSAALALKLAEAMMIEGDMGEMPLVLLDDVMSELDYLRQDYILNQIRDWQVFITCCDPNMVNNLKFGRCFEINEGKVISVR